MPAGVDEIKRINRENKSNKFVCFHSNGTPYDFKNFRDINQFGNDILYSNTSLKQPKDEQDGMKDEMAKLENYNPTNENKNLKKKSFIMQKNFLI